MTGKTAGSRPAGGPATVVNLGNSTCHLRRRATEMSAQVETRSILELAIVVLLALILAGCESTPEPAPPLVTIPGARVEQRGAGLFQIYEEPAPPDEDEEKKRAVPAPGRPAEITTLSGEVIRGRIVGRTDDAWQVLQGGGVRNVPIAEVKSLRLYPRNVRVLNDGTEEKKPNPRR